MRHRNRPFNILLLAAFLVSLSFPFLAAAAAGAGDQGSHWTQDPNRFSAFGVVESIDDGEMTVTLEGTSRLLKDTNGSSFVFQVQDSVRVKTFGGAMGKGGMMAGGKKGRHGARFTLADIQTKDNVIVTGSFDPATGNYNVRSIVIWLF